MCTTPEEVFAEAVVGRAQASTDYGDTGSDAGSGNTAGVTRKIATKLPLNKMATQEVPLPLG
jgi:hypothetical protein